MSQPALVDTGPLVALLDRRDAYHAWALETATELQAPLLTCEPVLTEAFHLLRQMPKARKAILEMSRDGLLKMPFQLAHNSQEILELVGRYENVPMSLADACLVRMSELL